ncbi:MAG: hypothetical protein CMF49_04420 [Legionellales bacterium]|nr:hypothetical protein [Legionellales bacterium]|tara:strand:+ start:1201 stop:1674 length:474 start_codon:yes stop_codon:yes gene_type:complete
MGLCRWSLSLKNTGFSLLEVLLVLALAAVVSIVAVRYYSEVRQTQKITTFTSQLTGISSAVEKCFAGSQNGGTSDCTSFTNLKNAGYLSDFYATSPWSTAIKIKIINQNQVAITSQIDHSACSKVVSRLNSVDSSNTASIQCGHPTSNNITYIYTIN